MIVVYFYLVFCYVSSVYTAICVSHCSHNDPDCLDFSFDLFQTSLAYSIACLYEMLMKISKCALWQ